MKNRNVIKISIIANIILIIIIFNLLIGNGIIRKNKQVIKEMTQTTLETELNNTIQQLNETQEKYAADVQAYKKQIAEAITAQGVNTSENDTGAVTATNIGKILEAGTADATATADNITAGKTAYVNGELITGTGGDFQQVVDNSTAQYLTSVSGASSMTVDISEIRSDYESLTADNFLVRITGYSLNYWVSTSGAAHGGFGNSVSCSQTYDASTGTLKLKNYGYTYTYSYGDYWTKTISVNAKLDLYCVPSINTNSTETTS